MRVTWYHKKYCKFNKKNSNTGAIIFISIVFSLFMLMTIYIPHAHAIEISKYSVKVYVEENEINENIEIKIYNNENNEIKTFRYPFSGKVYYFNVEENVTCTSSYEVDKTYITCYFRYPIKPGENATLKYIFKKPVEKTDDLYIFKASYILFANVKSFSLEVRLPEGYVVAENGVSPAGYKPDSDGRHVIIRWEYESVPPELRSFRTIILYEKVKEREFPYFLAVLIVVIVFIFLVLLKFFKKPFKVREKKDVFSKIEVLKEDEQKILKIIIENEGIEQRKIEEITGFSKAKVSKILSELEKRGLIVKKAFGRKNRIYLSDKMKS